MIYVCEYDYSMSSGILRKYAEYLPIPSYGGLSDGVKWKKYRERILAWLLFQNIVGSEKMTALDIKRTEYGKPYSAADPEFHFNISHCEHACACIISGVPCGIDIEKKFTMRENLIRKVCHPEEYAVLNKMLPEKREQQMRFLWSMKESFVKRDGRGLGYGLNSVNLAALLPVRPGEIKCKDGISYITGEAEAYTLAGCAGKQAEIQVSMFSEKELMDSIIRKNAPGVR